MDIDVYHIAGWLFAIGLTIYGLRANRSQRMVPVFLLAGLVLVVGAGQQGGLAVIEPRWHQSRYLFGFVITAAGLVLWALASRAGTEDAAPGAARRPGD